MATNEGDSGSRLDGRGRGFRANAGRSELRESLGPLVFVSQCTGITFFGKVEGTRSRVLLLAYRLLVLSALVLCLVHELPTIRFWVSNVRGLHAMLACVETWYRWTVLVVNFLLNASNNARIAATVSSLADLPIVVDRDVRNHIYRFQVFVIAFNLTLIACYMGIGHDEMWKNVNYKWYTSTIYVVTEFYIAFSNIQFVGILFAIRECFKIVNNDLRKCTFGGGNAFRDCTTTTTSSFFFLVDGRCKHGVDAAAATFDVVKFRELHLNLSCICLKLNRCYTVQILLFLVLCMIEITYSLRSSMVFIVSADDKIAANGWTRKPILEVVLTLFWGGYYVVNLLELVSSCDLTANEVRFLLPAEAVVEAAVLPRYAFQSRRTSFVVHELINSVRDKNLARQLQLFSLQLMNHAASFTAGRFFQLDFALLHSIIGAITTYLVIIITFRE